MNIKHIAKRIAFLALLASTVTSCQKDETQLAETAIQFTSKIGTTKASGTTWKTADSIGIYMFKHSDLTTLSANKKYLNTASDGTSATFATSILDQKIYYPVNGDAVDFIAYYPFKKGVTNMLYPLDVSVQTTQAAQEQVDFMLSNNLTNIGKTKNTQNLVFEHKLSNIVLNITAGGTFSTADLAGLSVKVKGLILSGSYSMVPSVASPFSLTGTATDLSLKVNAAGTLADGIVIPQGATGVKISLSLSGKPNAFETNIPTTAFQSGKQYVYNVEVRPTAISVASNSITNWIAGNSTGESLIAPPAYYYAIGDPYPNAINPVGVVWSINTDAAYYDATLQASTKGKIISLIESAPVTWGPSNVTTIAHDWDNGATNMITIKNLDPTYANYPAFAWCANYNAGSRIWYLPSVYELLDIKNVFSTVNTGLASISGAIQITGPDNYWSSREDAVSSYAWTINFTSGMAFSYKTNTHKVRAVSTF